MMRETVVRLSVALGQPFYDWVREKGFREDVAYRAVERYLKGWNIRGYRQQLVLRALYQDLGFRIEATQNLPSPKVVEALIREKLDEARKRRGGNGNQNL